QEMPLPEIKLSFAALLGLVCRSHHGLRCALLKKQFDNWKGPLRRVQSCCPLLQIPFCVLPICPSTSEVEPNDPIGIGSVHRLLKVDSGSGKITVIEVNITESLKRITEVALAVAIIFLQRLAKGGDGLFELRRVALPRPEGSQRNPKIALGRGPV